MSVLDPFCGGAAAWFSWYSFQAAAEGARDHPPMKHTLMKTLGPYLGLAAFALVIIALAFTPAGCQSTPQQRALVISLAQVGVSYAEHTGHLTPGTTVTISKGAAILKDETTTTEQKLTSLKDIAITEALARGDLKEGDKLIVDQAGTALVKVITAAVPKEDGPSTPLLPPIPTGETIADSLAPSHP